MSRPLCAWILMCAACAPSGTASAPPAPAAAATHERSAAHGGPPHGAHQHGSHGFHKDFSDAERFSAAFDDPARDAWQRPAEVLDHLRLRPGDVVVDLGAGTGYFAARLSERVGPSGKVLALDVEPEMIDFLKRRREQQQLSNLEPVLVPPDDPALAPGSVARVLIVNTWHHIDARPSYARKLGQSLAPGGEIWVVDFTPDSDLGPPAKYRLSAEQVVRELEQGGLRAEVVTPEQLPKQYLVRASR